MVESSTRVERTLRLDAPLAEAWEMLLDVPRWGMLFPHVDTIEPMGEGQYLWRMEPLGPPGRKVRVVYACRYDADEATRTLTWTPVEGVGNAAFAGACAIEPDGDAATVGHLQLDATLQIPVPGFLSAIVHPAVDLEMTRLTAIFAERLTDLMGT